MSIVPSLIGLRDPLASLFAKSGARAQPPAVDHGPASGPGADDAAAKSALNEMQITQHALRQIERVQPLLEPIA